MFRSLPQQLFLYLVPGMLLVLAVAGWSLDTLVDDQLTAYFDTTLDAKARTIVALTEQDEDGVELEVYADALPEFSQLIDPDYFHMLDGNGETLFFSPSSNGFKEQLPAVQSTDVQSILDRVDSLSASDGTTLYYMDKDLPDGRSGRWVVASYYPRIDPDDEDELKAIPLGTLAQDSSNITATAALQESVLVNGLMITPARVLTYVGISRVALDRLMWVIDLILLLTGTAIAAAIVLIASVGIRRAIAPLSQLSSDIGAVDERSLDSRIALVKPVAELEVLVDQFNKLLERLKTAFNRERQFSADVAHELRTPIAEMRTLIEVHARFPNDKVLASAFSDDLLESTARVQRLVEQLLALSKAEHDSIEIGEPLDLIPELHAQVGVYKEKALLRGMELEFECTRSFCFVSGSQVWPMILINLLDNAIDHSTGPGPIVLSLEVSEGHFCLDISNPSNDLKLEDMDSIFSRLWTKDSSRTYSNHSGLGLSLVIAYARLLDLDCSATLTPTTDQVADNSRFTITTRGECRADSSLLASS